ARGECRTSSQQNRHQREPDPGDGSCHVQLLPRDSVLRVSPPRQQDPGERQRSLRRVIGCLVVAHIALTTRCQRKGIPTFTAEEILMRRRVVDTTDSTIDVAIEDPIPLGLGRRSLLKGALASAPMLLVGPSLFNPRVARAAGSMGPSTTTEPYLVPSLPGVKTVSILTTGDSVNGYRMVGIPDGLGAFRGRRGDFTLLVNHEITAQVPGIVRAHGSAGAFVSRWRIDRRTLTVLEGQ